MSVSSLKSAMLSSTFPSSFITQDQQIEETTQVKRSRFLTESLSSTFPTENNQEILDSKLRRIESINSFEISNPSEKTNDFFSELSQRSSVESIIYSQALKGGYYGLPEKVKDLLLKLRNISCLYDWQHDLLTLMVNKLETLESGIKAFNDGENMLSEDFESMFKINLLYLSPTSGGKTLVAEILILYCLLRLRKNCIFVMPFVSIVQEKVQLMVPFGENLNFNIEEYAGVKGSINKAKTNSYILKSGTWTKLFVS